MGRSRPWAALALALLTLNVPLPVAVRHDADGRRRAGRSSCPANAKPANLTSR